MYRSDKQFMKNPTTTNARIYVGQLPKMTVSADLEEKFDKYGKILGLVLQSGFAFVQYENKQQAFAAIQGEHQSMLHNKKIVVKQAVDKVIKGGVSNGPPAQSQGRQQPPQMQHPQQQQQPKPLMAQFGNQRKPLLGESPVAPPPGNRGGRDIPPRGRFDPPQPLMQFPNTGGVDLHLQESGAPAEKRARSGWPPVKGQLPPSGFMGPPQQQQSVIRGDEPVGPPPGHSTDRNDCEIIVVSNALTEYAEYIEQRLKCLGLIVDLLFPNADVPIGRVLANISSRGCLYAILVMPQNKEHTSVTLNVLHGITQEHRNIPLEDCLIFISHNFEAYMRGDNMSRTENVEDTELAIQDRHPTPVQLLLNLLAENRQITTAQYDRMVRYMLQRRELQYKYEVDQGIEQEAAEADSKQTELQTRIMNILNTKSAPTTVKKEVPQVVPVDPEPAPSTSPSSSPALLKDPSVQKALDSLLGGDMFKNMTQSIAL